MLNRLIRISMVSLVSFCLYLWASGGQALATMGLGLQGGLDLSSVEAASYTFSLKDQTIAVLEREAMERPYMAGGFLYIDAIPVIDLEAAAELAIQKYHVDYQAGSVSNSEDAYWGRLSLYLTARKDIIKQPPIASVFALYIGGGVGFHYLAPMIGKDLVYDKIESGSQELKPEDIVERKMRTGFHTLVGIRIKPPLFPMGVKIESRYTMTGSGDYEEPGNFLSVYGAIFTGF